MIESLARSRRPEPEAQQLQTVLEDLMVQAKLPCLDEEALIRLMSAYATQENWDRFWEAWRVPPRFQLPRSAGLYNFVYRRMAATHHQARCIDAVRRCFFEMINEKPLVLPVGYVLASLKACIRVADPQAEDLAENLVVKDFATQKMANREFVRLLSHLPQFQG